MLRATLPLVAVVLVTLPWHPCQQALAAEPAAVPTMADCGHCPDASDTASPEHCVAIDKQPAGEARSAMPDPGESILAWWVPDAPRRAALLLLPSADFDPSPPPTRLHLRKSVLLI